jgi:uncharacterized protein (DUF305 family)
MRIAKTGRFAPIFFVSALAATSCSHAAGTQAKTDPGADADSAAQLEALYRARTDSARMNFTEADVRFMTGMIGHHAQALVMAGLAPSHGASPSVQILCARIINAQNDEIATMQQWLRDRDQPVPEVHVNGMTMTVDGPDYAMHMPGMLTADQLRKLNQATGEEFDRLFLTYMIQHHRGAVTMVDELFATNGAALDEATFKLASDIQADQSTEIARMELMLEEMAAAAATPPPPGDTP